MKGKCSHSSAALLRAQLHIRCGRRRRDEGKYPEGVSTMYDAVLSGMRWFALKNKAIHEEIHKRGEFILEDDVQLQQLIAESGVWPDGLDFMQFQSTVYEVIEENLEGFDRPCSSGRWRKCSQNWVSYPLTKKNFLQKILKLFNQLQVVG